MIYDYIHIHTEEPGALQVRSHAQQCYTLKKNPDIISLLYFKAYDIMGLNDMNNKCIIV